MMIVGVQGDSQFSDYNSFLRAMAVALSGLQDDDQHFYVYSAGPANINKMVTEFVNISERGMKARGKKVKFFMVQPSWLSDNMPDMGYFAYFTTQERQYSKLVVDAQSNNVEVGIFKY